MGWSVMGKFIPKFSGWSVVSFVLFLVGFEQVILYKTETHGILTARKGGGKITPNKLLIGRCFAHLPVVKTFARFCTA